ncbi:MAG: hypothetical protein A3D74_05785 [Candidatus Levybacteria bacterium RIFCSPHIGHO2_02_FULL_37_13]|nr:MAG: hypothetical protein A3D74_05785 [Candidatus Levybacteria bacterium RIFCSPHIGHO2_02_FULL_37_13]OGH30541.1 MAG: hypothetical protein A3E40_03260 [Candidatus Levybacteria bacterium RIFCSPHIGHO2_12_FULL_37_9]OGH40690.1 MAG: hypothetical protein A3B41_03755 [Candidatus Levybacteria bacterium RIFCSPLOWO2_01_FULL_37_26]
MVEKAENHIWSGHPRPPEEHEEMDELRGVAEELITSLENEDYELKIEGVVNVLSRFELKKQHHFEPKPHPKPFHPKPHGPKPGHPLPHELGHHPHEPGFEHPRPPVHGEHPEPSRPHEGPKH